VNVIIFNELFYGVQIKSLLRHQTFLTEREKVFLHMVKSIGIKVCTPNYDIVKESEWFKSAVFKVLDTLLGEKSFAMDIDHVDLGKLSDNPEEQGMIELFELPAFVKWKKAKLAAL